MEQTLKTFAPDDLARPGGHYSHAARFGDLLFTAGQFGIRSDGSHTADCSFDDQARQALDNMIGAVRGGGGDISTILKVTAYIVGIENWPRFNAIYAEAMREHRPARSVVPVPELHHGYLVEVDAVAACAPQLGISK